MSCHGCSESFGFLNRERGCPKCGFSYCKKCLRFKISATENGKEKQIVVCKRCFDIASNEKHIDKNNLNAPLSFQETVQVVKAIRRLESMENPAKPPIILYSKDSKPDIDNLRNGMTPEDQLLVDRLANLRNSAKNRRKSDNPADEIALRLAHLRDEEPGSSSTAAGMNPLLVSKKPETDEELMKRLAVENELDQRYQDNLVSDIESRLRRLREKPSSSGDDVKKSTEADANHDVDVAMDVEMKHDGDEKELTEEQEVQRIIERLAAEVAIDKSRGTEIDTPGNSGEHDTVEMHEDCHSDGSDDDNFCRICDAKATVSCKECDGDAFCASCFKEFHREIGEVHKPTRIQTK